MPDAVQLDHVALGLRRIADGLPLVRDVLGGAHLAGMSDGPYLWSQWHFAGGGVLELLEPDGPPGGFLHRFLDARGPGFHHVTFKVPSLVEITRRARDLGYGIVGYNDSHPSWQEAFLHPKQAQGIVVQMAQSDERKALPPAPEGAARILALHLEATDEKAVRRQWGELLGGTETEEDGELCFRWPDSPIAIRVRIGPDVEGPRHLAVASDRDLALPVRPAPELGARLVQE